MASLSPYPLNPELLIKNPELFIQTLTPLAYALVMPDAFQGLGLSSESIACSVSNIQQSITEQTLMREALVAQPKPLNPDFIWEAGQEYPGLFEPKPPAPLYPTGTEDNPFVLVTAVGVQQFTTAELDYFLQTYTPAWA